MPTFSKAPQNVEDLALAILEEFETHKPVLAAGVKIDYVFAFADVDPDTGEKINNAITSRGFRSLGQTRKMPLKDRAMGRGDAEIVLDADHWNEINDSERKALLDHELHHLEVRIDERGVLLDDLQRPLLRLRKHDVEVGWFREIAARHNHHSIERIQAAQIVEESGQYFFPEFCGELKNGANVTISAGDKSVTMSTRRFSNIAKEMSKK